MSNLLSLLNSFSNINSWYTGWNLSHWNCYHNHSSYHSIVRFNYDNLPCGNTTQKRLLRYKLIDIWLLSTWLQQKKETWNSINILYDPTYRSMPSMITPIVEISLKNSPTNKSLRYIFIFWLFYIKHITNRIITTFQPKFIFGLNISKRLKRRYYWITLKWHHNYLIAFLNRIFL
jgi:hypothetical protein